MNLAYEMVAQTAKVNWLLLTAYDKVQERRNELKKILLASRS